MITCVSIRNLAVKEYILKGRKLELTQKHYDAMIFYDFKERLDQEKYLHCLQLAYGDEAPSHVSIFRWFTVFCTGQSSRLSEEHTGELLSAVIPENAQPFEKF